MRLQKKGLQFYQTRSHAMVLYNTLPAVCIEKAVCMKTKEELYHKICLTPRVQDQQEQDARVSCDQPSGSKLLWETGSNTVDYRIPGVPLSAVEQQDTHCITQSQTVDREVREPPEQRILPSRLQADEGDQRIQQGIAGSHR